MSQQQNPTPTAFVVWYDKLLEEWFVTEQEEFEKHKALHSVLKEQQTLPKVVYADFAKEALDQVRPKPVHVEDPFFNTRPQPRLKH